nr:transaldolase [Neisseriaceae bacterium]
PNVLIKVPATDAGIAALTQLVAAGVNVNLTLLFSLRQVHKAYDAYVQGLIERMGQGNALDEVFVVASFFLSRIDATLDPTLPEGLQGKVAVALAKAAFAQWQAFFEGAPFKALASRGARVLPLLWASTGTKNKAYSDVMYVEEVMGAPTINTVPAATLEAFVHHGQGRLSLIENVATAQQVLADTAALGIDLEGLALRLQQEGLVGFDDAFAKLLALVA